MKRDNRKKPGIFLLLAGILLVIIGILIVRTAGGEEKPVDYSGRYTDKQGTSDIYSELELRRNDDGTYAVTIGIYRTATLYGTADDGLHFTSDTSYSPDVRGDITISGDKAEITITESGFPEIAPGSTFTFPDGKETW